MSAGARLDRLPWASERAGRCHGLSGTVQRDKERMTSQTKGIEGRRIGFVGGGSMAGALIRGLLHSATVTPQQIRASDVKPERLAELERTYKIETTSDNEALVRWADVIVLAVKPQIVDRVLGAIAAGLNEGDLVISVAAGVPIEAIEARLPEQARVIRSMPNTAAIALAGATAIAPGSHATADDVDVARGLFDAVGRCVVLDESLLDAVTGLSGSGPAYIMLMIEALADGGVKVGLGRDTALLLAAQTVYGAAKLQLETGEHPGRLKDMVTSPGGTAIAGLHTLESGGLRKTLIDAVESATNRSAELGEQMAKKLRKV
jgi:pyrroline-5-carboxylate reductase